MPIQVKYFASLRERLGRTEETLDADGIATVGDVWARVAGDISLSGNILVAVNARYADVNQPVGDGDEVAFFPPVTGG